MFRNSSYIIILFFLSPLFPEQNDESLLNKFENSLDHKSNGLLETLGDAYSSIDGPILEFGCLQNYCDCSTCCCEDEELRLGSGALLTAALTYIISSPFWGPKSALIDTDPYSEIFGYNLYPFYSGNGIYAKTGRDWMFNSNISVLNLSDDIMGISFYTDYTFTKKINAEYKYTKLKDNSQTTPKRINDFHLSYVFAKNDITDFRAGLGFTNFKGNNQYSGLKVFYGIRTFFNPFQYEFNIGYSELDKNHLLDLSTALTYHAKQLELKVGYRSFKTSEYTIQGPELSLGYWF